MKISDLINNDRESVVLAINLLGRKFSNFLLKNYYCASAKLVNIVLNDPDRLIINSRTLLIKQSLVAIDSDWF